MTKQEFDTFLLLSSKFNPNERPELFKDLLSQTEVHFLGIKIKRIYHNSASLLYLHDEVKAERHKPAGRIIPENMDFKGFCNEVGASASMVNAEIKRQKLSPFMDDKGNRIFTDKNVLEFWKNNPSKNPNIQKTKPKKFKL
jgi:hypothetical protein